MQRLPEDEDSRGQCGVVQEAPVLGPVGWGVNVSYGRISCGRGSDKLLTLFNLTLKKIKKIEAMRRT